MDPVPAPRPIRALVTGGAGFLGGHLVRRLEALGRQVVVLDDLSTGQRGILSPSVDFRHGDVRDAGAVASAMEGAELVFHLAAAVGPGLVARDPAGTWSRNVIGSAVVLDRAAVTGARTLILSSSEVYGDEQRRTVDPTAPMRETELVAIDPGARRDVYALSKLAAEAYALALYRAQMMPVTVVRPFNVVGPGQSSRYGMVLARFAEAAVRGTPLPVYGDGSQRRCFLHVSDAVEGLLALAKSPASEGRIVNLGGAEQISVLELAQRVLARVGTRSSSSQIEHIPFERIYGAGFRDHHTRTADTTLLRDLTGWAPRHSLDDAIRDVLGAVRSAP